MASQQQNNTISPSRHQDHDEQKQSNTFDAEAIEEITVGEYCRFVRWHCVNFYPLPPNVSSLQRTPPPPLQFVNLAIAQALKYEEYDLVDELLRVGGKITTNTLRLLVRDCSVRLVKYVVDVYELDVRQHQLLVDAVGYNKVELVEYLVVKGIDIRKSVVAHGFRHQALEALQKLCKLRAYKMVRNYAHQNARQIIKSKNIAFTEWVVSELNVKFDPHDYLNLACRYGNISAVTAMCDQGADIPDKLLRTVLSLTTHHDDDQRCEVLKLLLQRLTTPLTRVTLRCILDLKNTMLYQTLTNLKYLETLENFTYAIQTDNDSCVEYAVKELKLQFTADHVALALDYHAFQVAYFLIRTTGIFPIEDHVNDIIALRQKRLFLLLHELNYPFGQTHVDMACATANLDILTQLHLEFDLKPSTDAIQTAIRNGAGKTVHYLIQQGLASRDYLSQICVGSEEQLVTLCFQAPEDIPTVVRNNVKTNYEDMAIYVYPNGQEPAETLN